MEYSTVSIEGTIDEQQASDALHEMMREFNEKSDYEIVNNDGSVE